MGTLEESTEENLISESLRMTSKEALSFISEYGIVLERARGARPNLVEQIAGERVSGSWWAHPKSHKIFAILTLIRDSPDVISCRLIDNKITLIHRRVWPALVRLSRSLPTKQLAAITERHTESGKHISSQIPFPKWVPAEIREQGKTMSREKAVSIFGEDLFQFLTQK